MALLAIEGSIQTVFQSYTNGLAFPNPDRACISSKTHTAGLNGLFVLLFVLPFSYLQCMSFRSAWHVNSDKSGALPCQSPRNLLGTLGRDCDGLMQHWRPLLVLMWELLNCQGCTRYIGPCFYLAGGHKVISPQQLTGGILD